MVLGSQPAQVERTSSLYVPAELSGSRLETASAALLYILDMGLLLVIAATFRWALSLSRPD